MKKRLLSASEVKAMLNVTDFRSISKDKLVEFVSAIPDMDKEVAIKIIEQFPAFSEYAKCTVLHLYNMYDRLLQSNTESSGTVMAAYANTLDMLSTIAAEEKLSIQDRRWFAEKAVEVADKMAAFDRENKGFLEGAFKVGAYILGGGLILCAALLGINIRASRDAGA